MTIWTRFDIVSKSFQIVLTSNRFETSLKVENSTRLESFREVYLTIEFFDYYKKLVFEVDKCNSSISNYNIKSKKFISLTKTSNFKVSLTTSIAFAFFIFFYFKRMFFSYYIIFAFFLSQFLINRLELFVVFSRFERILDTLKKSWY